MEFLRELLQFLKRKVQELRYLKGQEHGASTRPEESLTPRQKSAQRVFLRAAMFFALCCASAAFLITSPITPRNVFWLCIMVVLAVINCHIMRAAYRTWSSDKPFEL